MKLKKNSKDILIKKIRKFSEPKAKKVLSKPRILISSFSPEQASPESSRRVAQFVSPSEPARPQKPSRNLRVFRFKTKFANIAKKEIILFPKRNYSLSFKPFLAAQGLVVLFLFVVIASFFIPQQNKLNEALVIKSATTKQTSTIVAGQPAKWMALVNRSDITNGKYLLKLPKGATNVKITTITSKQATVLLEAKPQEQLSLVQRQQLASSKQANKGFLATITGSLKYFFANLERSASDVIDAIIQPEPEGPDITETEDAVVVDLSAQADLSKYELKDQEKQEKQETKEEKKQDTEQEQPDPVETPLGTPASTESSGEVTPDATPEITIEISPEITPEITPSPSVEPTPSETPPETPAEPTESIIDTTSPSDEPIIAAPTPAPDLSAEALAKEDIVQVTYETPAPTITEQNTNTGKLVTVSSPESVKSDLTPTAEYTDVLASTNIPEIYKVGQENRIQIKWKSNGDQPMEFHAYDTDNNGKLDYVEWAVPHLSEQVFEIIFISKAFQLDQDQNIIADIYDTVATQDGNYATVPAGNYVRVTFEQVLDNTKDITVYARQTPGVCNDLQTPGVCNLAVEVYPVYTDGNGNLTEGAKLDLASDGQNPDFSNISADPSAGSGQAAKYRVLLTNLATPTDVFDLKVTGGDVDVDYVVDPAGWLTGWSYRKKITVSNTDVGEDLSYFPLYVKLAADAGIGDGALATGYDIRFTSSDGITNLPYERESWTGGAGDDATANFWVRVPTVTTAAATTIYIYYGNASASTDWTADTSTITDCTLITNALCVWKEGASQSYNGVWHLKEATGSNGADSTTNNKTATQYNSPVQGAGKVGGGLTFTSSSSQYLQATPVDFSGNTATFESWVQGHTTNQGTFFIQRGSASVPNDWGFYDGFTSNKFSFYLYNTSNALGFIEAATVMTIDTWYHLVGTYDGSNVRIYVNGSSDAAPVSQTGNVRNSASTTMNFAVWPSGSTRMYMNGKLDEVRVSSTVRSPNWIKFEYCNQTNSDTAACGASNNYELAFDGGQPSSVGADESYWVGGTGSWSEASTHWSLSSGGSATADAMPGTTTNVHFDSNSGGGTATVDSAVSVATVVMDTGNTTGVTLGATLTTSGAFTLTAGTFATSSYAVTNGGMTLQGATLTGSGTIAVNGDLLYTSGTNSHTGAWTQGTGNLGWDASASATIIKDYSVAANATVTLTANVYSRKTTVPSTATIALTNKAFGVSYNGTTDNAVSLLGTWSAVGGGYVLFYTNDNRANSGQISIGTVQLIHESNGSFTLTQSGAVTCGTLSIYSLGAGTVTTLSLSQNLIAGQLVLGSQSAADRSGILSLGSGTHSIASIAAGNAANLNNAIDFGTSSTTISGTANLTNIKTVSSAAATLSAAAWTLDSSATNNLTWTSTGILNLTGPVTLSQTAGTTILNLGTYATSFTVGAGVNALNLNGGTLQGSGALTFNGGLLYTSGTNSHTGAWTQGTGNVAGWGVGGANTIHDYTVASNATITLTGLLGAAKVTVPASATVNIGTNQFYIGYLTTVNDFASLAVGSTWTSGVGGVIYVRFTSNKSNALPFSVGAVPVVVMPSGNITWTQNAALTCGSLTIYSSATAGWTGTLTLGGNLTTGAVTLGNPTATNLSGVLNLGSGTHTIASIARGNAANLNNAVNFGTSNTTITGNADFTGIAVSNTSATLNFTGTTSLTSAGATLPTTIVNGTSVTLNDTTTFGSNTLTLTAGTFATGAYAVTNGGMTLQGGTLTGSGTIAINGNLIYTSGTNSHTGAWTQGTGNLGWNINTIASAIRNYVVADSASITLTGTTYIRGPVAIPSTASVNLGDYVFAPGYYQSSLSVSLEGTWSAGTGYVYITSNNNQSNSAPISIGTVQLLYYANGSRAFTQNGLVSCGALMIYGNAVGDIATLNANGNVTAGAVTLGTTAAVDKSGVLNLGSGTHTIASIARGNAANTADAIDFGTSNTTITGNANFTGIAVSNTSATLNFTGTTTLTSAGNTMPATVINGTSTTLADTTTFGSNTLTLTAGTFATGAYGVTNGGMTLQGATLTGSGTIAINGNLLYTSGTNSHTGAWTQGTGNLGWWSPSYPIADYTVADSAVITLTNHVTTNKITVPSSATVHLGAYQLQPSRYSTGTVSLAGTWDATSGFVIIRKSADSTMTGTINIGSVMLKFYQDVSHTFTQNGAVICGELRVDSGTAGVITTLTLGSNLTAAAVKLGDIAGTTGSGILSLGSGTHTIASIARGNAANLNNAINFGTSNTSISGNANFTGIAVTTGASTVTLNGTGAQTITSAGAVLSTLVVTNASVAGVTFADRLQTATLTDTTDASKLGFAAASAGSPHTITSALNLTGGASKITLAPSVAETTWYISAPSPTTVTNVIVSYSNSTNHITPVTSTDGGNNVNWDFDITPPTQSAWSPSTGSTITTATPTITLTLNENGDCKSSLTDQAYADMTTDCTGDGTTSISCTTSSLAPDGVNKSIYIACQDTLLNKDTAGTNTGLTYTLDTTPPTGAGISSITADSTSQLTVTAETAVDETGLHATPYQFKKSSSELGWQASVTYIDSGLTPNTSYSYQVQAKDALGNASDYSVVSSKYTLANVPGTPTLTADSASQITTSWSANSNPDGTQYYITNTTNSTNSGWTTTRAWISSGLTCNTEYTFTVKAKNGDGAETTTTTSSTTTLACPGGGGGLPAGAYLPPSAPITGFSVQINNGATTTTTQDIVLNLRGSSDTNRMSISNDANFTNAVQESYQLTKQWRLSDGEGQKTVYVKFFTFYGVSSDTITASINYQKQNILTPIINIIIPPPPPPPTIPIEPPLPPLPPAEETVLKEAPKSLSNTWDIMPTKSIEGFVFQPLAADLKIMAEKFPQLGITLNALGITKATDLEKLYGNNLSLPGLSMSIEENVRLGELDFSSLSPEEQNVRLGGLGIPSLNSSGFTLPQGVSLGQIPLQLKEKIPTDAMFVRGGNGTIDKETSISISNTGEIQQTMTAVTGENIQLIIKPESSAKAIKGYLIFKQRGTAGSSLPAGLENGVQQALVVKEFYYDDKDGDGIWTADITVPVVDGEYEIINVIEYNNPNLLPKELKLITVIDPEGYIYYQTEQGKLRLENAKISLFWLNPKTNKYELWPAKNYQQTNPQITDDTGRYSFLTPQGTYYLLVEANGYSSYKGEKIEVSEGNEIHQNIGLEKSFWILKYLDWKAGAILLLIFLVAFNFYRDRRRAVKKS